LFFDSVNVSIPPYFPHSTVTPSILEGRVFLAAAAASPQNILGCIVWNTSVTEDGDETLYFGPLAVAPDAQGKGVGGFLVSAVESLAATLRATSAPKLRSVRYSFAYMRMFGCLTARAACARSIIAPISYPGT
jgi:GNAT superfamily N-acetyltransferase